MIKLFGPISHSSWSIKQSIICGLAVVPFLYGLAVVCGVEVAVENKRNNTGTIFTLARESELHSELISSLYFKTDRLLSH